MDQESTKREDQQVEILEASGLGTEGGSGETLEGNLERTIRQHSLPGLFNNDEDSKWGSEELNQVSFMIYFIFIQIFCSNNKGLKCFCII